MRYSDYFFIFIYLLLSSCHTNSDLTSDTIALIGGTIIDLKDFGHSDQDMGNSLVIIKDGLITHVGTKDDRKIPAGVRQYDISGKWVIPGLIDGFSTLNDQGFANSFLYNGVTTIVGLGRGGRRGYLFHEANPSPEIKKFDSYHGLSEPSGSDDKALWKSDDEIRHDIDSLAKAGVEVLLIHYGVKPYQMNTLIKECRKSGIVTIGELGHSYVRDGIEAGIHSFVHTSRYSADIIPKEIREPYKTAPFGKPRLLMYEYFESFDPLNDPVLLDHAFLIGESGVGLLPTFSIFYPSFPSAVNPWENPSAKLIESDSIHLPVNKESGRWSSLENTESWDTLVWSREVVTNLLMIEKQYARYGARYLTGTGTDAFGAMPGISIHSELEMLVMAGLSNREALAAATSNFCEIYGWDQIGQIKEGSEADILVLAKNPLENLENLKSLDKLYLDGKEVNLQTLLLVER